MTGSKVWGYSNWRDFYVPLDATEMNHELEKRIKVIGAAANRYPTSHYANLLRQNNQIHKAAIEAIRKDQAWDISCEPDQIKTWGYVPGFGLILNICRVFKIVIGFGEKGPKPSTFTASEKKQFVFRCVMETLGLGFIMFFIDLAHGTQKQKVSLVPLSEVIA